MNRNENFYLNTLNQIDVIDNSRSIINSIERSIEILKIVLEKNKVSSCHGIEHAKAVMCHAWQALKYYNVSEKEIELVLISALLHDSDDSKFFPENKNNENLTYMLKAIGKDSEFINNASFLINIVSSSKWGDKIPPDTVGKEGMLVPRYADRVEAIGMVGIERCYIFNENVSKTPLFLDTTPKSRTEDEVWKHATIERYQAYNGSSVSMIDHYYDKLLRLSVFPIRNKYFDDECKKKRQPLIDFVIYFGKKGSITKGEIENFIKLYPVF